MLWLDKYKPGNKEEFCRYGNRKLYDRIEGIILTGQNAIIYGPCGTGKSLILECILKDFPEECIYVMDTCSDRGIKNIRTSLQTFLKQKLTKEGGQKVVLIKDLVNMSDGPQYGLCSLMEKYPHVSFIFCCQQYKFILERIQSRCMIIEFPELSASRCRNFVENVILKEGEKGAIQYDPEIFDLLYEHTGGDMRQYLLLIQVIHMSEPNEPITVARIRDFIQQSFKDTLKQVVSDCIRGDYVLAWKKTRALLETGYNHSDLVIYLFHYCLSHPFADEQKQMYFLEKIGKCHIAILRGLYSDIQLDKLLMDLTRGSENTPLS